MIAVLPGEALRLEMDARGLSADALAQALRMPSEHLTDILNGKRAVTTDTALRLGRHFGTGAELWLNLQIAHDLASAEAQTGPEWRRNRNPT